MFNGVESTFLKAVNNILVIRMDQTFWQYFVQYQFVYGLLVLRGQLGATVP